MNYGDKNPDNMMYGPSPRVPTILNTEEWDRFRAAFNRRADRLDLLMPDGRAVRYTGRHRALSKKCPCNVCKARKHA